MNRRSFFARAFGAFMAAIGLRRQRKSEYVTIMHPSERMRIAWDEDVVFHKHCPRNSWYIMRRDDWERSA